MGFKCGLVGMPNVGKSSIFNLLTSQKIDAKNFPFCTIDPNIATVEVPDDRLDKLSELNTSKSKINAVIEFVDIAISTNSITALILLFDVFNSDNLSNLSSGTSTVAIFGSIVQKGKFLASIFCEVNKLNMDDLPTFGIPTKPHLNPIVITIYIIHEICIRAIK